jgi:hypothetical protein
MPGMSVAVDVDLGHDRDHGTRDVVRQTPWRSERNSNPRSL